MSELIDRERFSADMRDFQNRVGIWRDEAEDTETRTRADAALATIIETKLILDKQPTIPASPWHRVEDDAEFLSLIISEICSYSVKNEMEPDDSLRTVAQNILKLLKISTFNNWMPIEPPQEEE